MKKLLTGIAFVATLMFSSQWVWNGALTGWGVFWQQTNNLISQQSPHIAIKLKTFMCCKNCGLQMCLLACCNYNHGHSSLSYYYRSVLLVISGLFGLSLDACGGKWPLSLQVLLVSAIQKMQFCRNWDTLPPVKGSGLLCLWQKNLQTLGANCWLTVAVIGFSYWE